MSRALTSSRDGHVYEFAPTMEPVYEAADATASLTIETIDSLNGAIQTDDDRLDAIPEVVNAATGPIGRGGEPGRRARGRDRGRARHRRPRARSHRPGFGLLQDDPEIEHPATRITEVDAEGASEQIDFEGIDVPIEPVIGTIGVATAEDRSRRSPRTTTAATSTRPT